MRARFRQSRPPPVVLGLERTLRMLRAKEVHAMPQSRLPLPLSSPGHRSATLPSPERGLAHGWASHRATVGQPSETRLEEGSA